jgi:hypothetical protein
MISAFRAPWSSTLHDITYSGIALRNATPSQTHPSLLCLAILVLLISLCTSSNTVSIYPPLHCDVEVDACDQPCRRKDCHCAFTSFQTARCSQDGCVVPTYLGIDDRLCGLVVLESAVIVLYQHPCPQSTPFSISDKNHGRQIVSAHCKSQ